MTNPATAPHDDTTAPVTDEAVAAQELPADTATVTDATALAAERDEWKDKAYRLAADMENLRRRHAQELENTRNFSLQNFAKELLPVADNLARALDAAASDDPLKNGVTMVAAGLQQTLQRQGVTRLEVSPGQPFNHDHHQVMAQVPSAFPAGHVVAELQAGFLLNGRLLRPAFVTVSTGTPAPDQPSAAN